MERHGGLWNRSLDRAHAQHDGKLPEYEQKDEFKQLLNAGRTKSDEENFDEADNKAFFVTNRTEVRLGLRSGGAQRQTRQRRSTDWQVPSNIQELLQEDSVRYISAGVRWVKFDLSLADGVVEKPAHPAQHTWPIPPDARPPADLADPSRYALIHHGLHRPSEPLQSTTPCRPCRIPSDARLDAGGCRSARRCDSG